MTRREEHAITWSDGSVTRARTWQEMLDRVRAFQWHDLDEFEFRCEMSKRAWRWSNTTIDWDATPRKFFRELERAHMIVIGEDK